MGKDKKTVMGKDTHGTFHPGKGKPSGINKEEGLGLQATDPEKLDDYLELTDKYIAGEDTLAENVPVRHPNRNTTKGATTYKAKENTPESDKSKNETFTEERTTTVAEQLPGVLTKDRFIELANYKADCTVSIYIPTHRSGVEVNEQFDVIGFKNVLNSVEQLLKEKGHNQGVIENLLKPGYDLIRNNEFWLDLTESLAVFIAEGFFKYIKMPVETQQKIIIEPTFYVSPLVPIMMSSEYFYLLVISKHKIKLFKADAFGMYPVAVKLPDDIEQVKRLPDRDATTFRTGESGRRASAVSQPGQTHGAGGGNPDGKDNIATYFEAVDDILWDEVFCRENAPLMLAGVEYEIPIYKSVCDYHNVWDAALTGSRERQDTKSLYVEAKEVMQPYFQQRTNKALQAYGNRSATQLTSSNVEEVVPAVYYSRVAQLFVCKDMHVWGSFDEVANELSIHEPQRTESEDLIDHAVVKTLANGGEVFLLDKEQMPGESCIAALMRY